MRLPDGARTVGRGPHGVSKSLDGVIGFFALRVTRVRGSGVRQARGSRLSARPPAGARRAATVMHAPRVAGRMLAQMQVFTEERILTGVVSVIVATLVVYFAAKIVLDSSSILAALGTALLGTFLAGLVEAAVEGIVGTLLGVAVWALVAAFFFRTHWLKGVVIGIVAAVLWWLIGLIVGALR